MEMYLRIHIFRQLTVSKQFAEDAGSSHQNVDNFLWHVLQQPLINQTQITITMKAVHGNN